MFVRMRMTTKKGLLLYWRHNKCMRQSLGQNTVKGRQWLISEVTADVEVDYRLV